MRLAHLFILFPLYLFERASAGSGFSCLGQSCPTVDEVPTGDIAGTVRADERPTVETFYEYKGVLPDVFTFPPVTLTEAQGDETNSEPEAPPTTTDDPQPGTERERLVEQDALWKTPRCIGPIPRDLAVSAVFGVGRDQPAFRTPRELCAKREYGGSLVWNAGGFCGNQIPSSTSRLATRVRQRKIRFDVYGSVGLAQVQMFCSLRCRCRQPQGLAMTQYANSIAGSERVPPDDYDPDPLRGDLSEVLFMNHALFNAERGGFNFAVPHEADGLGMTTKFWSIPPPSDWRKPELLNVQLPPWLEEYILRYTFGGHAHGEVTPEVCLSSWHTEYPTTAGFFCRQQTESTQILDYREWLSHPALLPTVEPYGLALHLFCRATLWCRGDEPFQEPRLSVTLPYFQNQNVKGEMDADGSHMRLVTRGRSYPDGPAYNIPLGPVDGQSQARGQDSGEVSPCGYYRVGKCVGRWPSNILPLPGYPPVLATERGSYNPGRPSLQDYYENPNTKGTCGAPCRKFSDCASEAHSECRCVVNPSNRQMASIGRSAMQHVTYAAFCIPTSLISAFRTAKGRSGLNVMGGLRGRALAQLGEGDTICRCNGTFAATACCFDPEGTA